jgi:beta-lactamase regulating signal transducer with metallopeptidase domain/protocatechuate 3,4-dioxygenase beta subunit
MWNEVIELGNSLAEPWARWMGGAILDATIVLTAVSLLWLVLRRKAPPQLGYLLFLLVPLKLFVPLEIAVPERLVAWMPAMATTHMAPPAPTPVRPSDASLPKALTATHTPVPSATELGVPATAAVKASEPFSPPVIHQRASLSFLAWLMLGWGLGVLVLLTRLIRSQIRFHRDILQKADAVAPATLPLDFDALLHSIGVRRRIRVVESDALSSPVVWGIFRPTLLLPAGIAAALSARQLEWVLLHELAHVRRWDLAVRGAQCLVAILHFANPAVWIANHMINRLREYACDDLAVTLGHGSQLESGEAFLGVMRYAASLHHRPTTNLEGAIGLFESTTRASCFQRMKRLLDTNRRIHVKLRFGSICLLLLTAALALPQIRAATPQTADKVAAKQDGQLPNGVNPAQDDKKASDRAKASPTAGLRFELTVLGPDGKPVPRASVEIRTDKVPTAEQLLHGTFVKKDNYGIWLQTDANGSLLLDLPKKPSRFQVFIRQPEFGPYYASWDSADRHQTIPSKFVAELEAGWSVGGVIVDSHGSPIQGVKVCPRFPYKTRPGDTQEIWSGASVTTDAQGKWRFDSVPVSKSDVFVEMSHPAFQPNRRSLPRSGFGLRPGEQPVAKIEMQRGVTVTGRVTDDEGNPIAGALIRTKFLNDRREAKTNDSGEYLLVGCEPRMARIVVSAKGRAIDMKEVRIDPSMDPVDFQMKPGGKVRIRVLDAQGNPVAKARIFFQQWRGDIQQFEFDHVNDRTDKNGVWQWNEAPLDEFRADICPPGGMQLPEQPFVAREKEYVVRLPAPLVISGRVIDAKTREPVKSFRVVPGIRGESHMNWARGLSYLAADGQYRFQPNRGYLAHLVRIEAEGYRVAVSREIKSTEGTVQIDFELTKAEDIAATVLTPENQPAAGAKVALGIVGSQISVANGTIDDGSTYAARSDTDSAGRFRFSSPEGDYQLVITHPSGFAYLKSDEQELPGKISLTAWARVEGTFRVASKPVANVPITINTRIIHSYGNDVPSIFTHHDVTTGADGRFVFERVFPGKARIGRRIMLTVENGATDVTSSAMVHAEFPAGKTTSIDLGGSGRPVIGKLAGPAGHKEKVLWNFALVDVQLNLPGPPPPDGIENNPERRKAWQAARQAYEELRTESPAFSASVARDGSFRIDDMPPGDYVLMVHFSQHRAGHLSNHRFSVPPTDARQAGQPLDLGTLALEKN